MVEVLNNNNEPQKDVTINFQVVDGDANLTDSIVVTQDDGLAKTFVKIGSKSGSIRINANAFGLEGSPVTFSFYASASEPFQLLKIAGDQQEGKPGTSMSDMLEVQVVDKYNNPVSNEKVLFNVTSGNGHLNVQENNTDQQGIAKVRFTFGTDQATNIVSATTANNVKTSFRLYSVIAAKINPIVKKNGHVEISWTNDSVYYFKSYQLYRRRSSYSDVLIKTFENSDSTKFSDYDVYSGESYDYYVITTTQNHTVYSDLARTEFGYYLEYEYTISDVKFDKNGDFTYVSHPFSNQISIISNSLRQKVDSIQLDFTPQKIFLSQDQSKLFIISPPASLVIVNLSTKQVTSTIDLSGLLPNNYFIRNVFESPYNDIYVAPSQGSIIVLRDEPGNVPTIAFNNQYFNFAVFMCYDSQYLYIGEPNYSTRTLSKYDYSQPYSDRILTSSAANEVGSVSPDGTLFYEGASVYRTSDFHYVGTLPYGYHITLSQDGKRSYQLYTDGIGVVDTETLTLLSKTTIYIKDQIQAFITPDESTAIVQSFAYGRPTRLYFVDIN